MFLHKSVKIQFLCTWLGRLGSKCQLDARLAGPYLGSLLKQGRSIPLPAICRSTVHSAYRPPHHTRWSHLLTTSRPKLGVCLSCSVRLGWSWEFQSIHRLFLEQTELYYTNCCSFQPMADKVLHFIGVSQCAARFWIHLLLYILLFVLICDLDNKWLTL
jgi:hypothetical protein